MDDDRTLCVATECELADPEMSNVDDELFAGASEPANAAVLLPVEPMEAPAFDVEEPETLVPEPTPDAAEPEQEVGDAPADPAATLRQQVIEALLFSSDTPLSAARLADLVDDCTPSVVRKHIAALNEKYEQAGLTFRIESIARGYRMMTLAERAAEDHDDRDDVSRGLQRSPNQIREERHQVNVP